MLYKLIYIYTYICYIYIFDLFRALRHLWNFSFRPTSSDLVHLAWSLEVPETMNTIALVLRGMEENRSHGCRIIDLPMTDPWDDCMFTYT